MLEIGQPAPTFRLPDSDMEMLGLKDFKGKNLILYFYPKDDTPGCTIQAVEFSESIGADMEDAHRPGLLRLAAAALRRARNNSARHRHRHA